jgi:tetratricopeptide (TPR) repeat protein
VSETSDPLQNGDCLAASGNFKGALASFKAAIDGAPINARARAADMALKLGKPDQAFALAEEAWRIAPSAPEALLLMGRIAWRVGAIDDSLRCLDRIRRGSPLWPRAQAERAEALVAGKQPGKAYNDLRSALKSDPRDPSLWLALGHVLMGLNRLDEAEDAYRNTTDLDPESVRALAGIADVCLQLGRAEEAVEAGEKALELSENDPVARTIMAHALLAIGRDDEGWASFEARFDAHNIDRRVGNKARDFEMPHWDGSPLEDKSILIWGEGSPADEIRFSALVPEMIRRDPSPLILECDPRLLTLFERSFDSATVVPRTSPPHEAISDGLVHWQSAIGGLCLRTQAWRDGYALLSNGYLEADPDKTAGWQERWQQGGERVIGLAWRHPDPEAARRSIPLQPVLDTVALPGRTVVSLQRGMTAEERELASDRLLLEPDPDPNDVDALAARVAACDVVVSVDSLVAHLGAALGKDTRVLLDNGADARWGLGKARTPWYPSTRLYWQDHDGSWDKAITALRRALDGA